MTITTKYQHRAADVKLLKAIIKNAADAPFSTLIVRHNGDGLYEMQRHFVRDGNTECIAETGGKVRTDK